MKRIVFLFAALFCFTFALSAQTSEFSINNRTPKLVPDSVRFYEPEFINGRIYYSDGGYSNGLFNIETYGQTIYFVDTDGVRKHMTNDDTVIRVILGKKTYYKYNAQYVCFVDNIDNVYLSSSKSLEIKTDAKKSGYGGMSETTSISQMNSFHSGGLEYNLDTVTDLDYTLKQYPYLYMDGKFYPMTKNRLKKFLPAYADKIDAYLATHNVFFNRTEDVQQLFSAIK